MKKLLIVVGTRPNFIKVTQFKKLAPARGIEVKIVHTGQHYDARMSEVFFEQFGLVPDHFLEVPPGSPNQQMANIMLRLEEVVNAEKPDMIMVPGDVNSTFAAALTANKMGYPIGHLESGLRSFDRGMPEEINRVLTDEITNHYFVTEQSGLDNLEREKRTGKVHFVGNTMIDTIVAFEEEIKNSDILEVHKLEPNDFVLMTIHRPAMVDHHDQLQKLCDLILNLAVERKVVFPIHPRTIKNLEMHELMWELKNHANVVLTEPLDYFAFQKLIATCRFIVTDSGGIQEESTFRQVPCLTLRPNTERPSTIEVGTNELVPFDLDVIQGKVQEILDGNFKKGEIPPLWDGRATERILDVLKTL